MNDANLIVDVVEVPVPGNGLRSSEKKSFSKPGSTETNSSNEEEKADNGNLTRAIAGLPHLSITNCRITVVLMDETNNNEDISVEFGIGAFLISEEDSFKTHDEGNSVVNDENTFKNTESNFSPPTFIYKSIRTGSGINGGIWIKVLPSHISSIGSDEDIEVRWARSRWQSLCLPMFLISGLDLKTRVISKNISRKEEDGGINDTDNQSYNDYAIDSMLVAGWIDIAHPAQEETAEEEEVDQPDVQTESFPSKFYVLVNGINEEEDIHPLTHSTPLPGTVLFLFTELLEINLERQSLETISRLLQLQSLYCEYTAAQNATSTNNNKTRPVPTRQRLTTDEEDSQSFPICMQPDTLVVAGLHFPHVTLRCQLLPQQYGRNDFYGFAYGELLIRSIDLDFQEHTSFELSSLSHIEFSLGEIEWQVWRGCCEPRSPFSVSRSDKAITSTLAAQLLQIQHPTSTVGVLFRSKCVGENRSESLQIIGSCHVDYSSSFYEDIMTTQTEIKDLLFPDHTGSTIYPWQPFAWNYHYSCKELTVTYGDFSFKFPETVEVNSFKSNGSYEMVSVLPQIGMHCTTKLPQDAIDIGLLIGLPENCRMSVLLYTGDIAPLATAVGWKARGAPSRFLGCFLMNKYLSSLDLNSLSTPQDLKGKYNTGMGQKRQRLLKRLQGLDNNTLEKCLGWVATQTDSSRKATEVETKAAFKITS